MFDGVQIGLLQDVRFNEDYAPAEASGVGNIRVVEYVPTMAKYTVSARFMVLNLGSMYKAGVVVPKDADGVMQGFVFDIAVYDNGDGSLLRKAIGCSYASGDIEIQKHAILVSSANFNALDVSGTL
jgi:hypothetical protein